MDAVHQYRSHIGSIRSPKILELGTGRWDNNKATHHRAWAPDDAEYVMSDVFKGIDVDVVADAHDLSPFADNEFDAVIAISVWEHLRKPWLAAASVHRVLKPGGAVLIETHFAFPVHGYPSDYCRWTDEGLKGLFDEPEWRDRVAKMHYPCTITPPKDVKIWNPAAPAFLNSNIFAIKS